ncbi:hypothetical protein ABEF95_013809 [Exophiala dermatitidis]
MSLKYNPDPEAVPDKHWDTVFLSLRDAAARIPINFITSPGVHLTKACFSDGVYDDIPAQTCISDLLASQFRRLIVDLYWDNINRQFNFCPVELPPLAGNATGGYSVDVSALSAITATSTPSSKVEIHDLLANPQFIKRQSSDNATSSTAETAASSSSDGATSSTTESPASSSSDAATSLTAEPTTSSSSVSTSSSTTTTAAPVSTTTGVSGTTLLELGPYKCSLELNLDSILSLYDDYFDQTSTTISARLHYLIINIHAAAPFTAPLDPAQNPMQSRLPRTEELIGSQFKSKFPDALFTPRLLEEDRHDLNRSWLRGDFASKTDTSYFSTSTEGDGSITQNGWPGEEWILLTDGRRILVSWGDVDPQMDGYNFSSDSQNVFDAWSIETKEGNGTGNSTANCFYQPGETTVSQVNSSWATTTINGTNIDTLTNLAQNLTFCGISPILNATVGDSAVQHNLDLYQKFAQSATFGWASGEPLNVSKPSLNISGSADNYRCAVIDSTSGYLGRWRVEDCSKKRRVACRIASEPYAWRLSTFTVPFSAASDACPEHTTFGLPRTGLENTYLYRHILNVTSTGDDDADSILSGTWINFNSLDQVNCWTADGPNATCPYAGHEEQDQQRQVLIPTIAALIVLVLTVLTLLVKCNQHRRSSRARRRGDDGWEYEGVPS